MGFLNIHASGQSLGHQCPCNAFGFRGASASHQGHQLAGHRIRLLRLKVSRFPLGGSGIPRPTQFTVTRFVRQPQGNGRRRRDTAIQYQPMPSANIQFNSSICRGVIGEDFTLGRVRMAAAAFARAARSGRKLSKLLVAGDTRFFSDEFARAAALFVGSERVHALLSDRPTPAAAVSLEVLRRKLAGAIYIGSGRDPAEYSGLKFFGADGVALGPQAFEKIEQLGANPPERKSSSKQSESRELETIDPSAAYLERLGELVRLGAIGRAGIELVYDAMHGAAAGWLDRLLVAEGVRVLTLNAERDVLFDGRVPNPVPANLSRLADIVRESGAALGLATDADGGHFGILDGQGRFVPPDHFFGLLYDYLVESRGWRLGVAHGEAGSPLADAVARHHGLRVYPAASGSERLGPLLAQDRIAAALDGDGGVIVRGHVPEGDGILACLLAAEMVAERGPIEKQMQKLFRRVGAE